MMFRVTSVGCFLLVIVFLNLSPGFTYTRTALQRTLSQTGKRDYPEHVWEWHLSRCSDEGASCEKKSDCCFLSCCWSVCDRPCRLVPGKRARLQKFLRHR
uniref:I-superfamily Sr11.10 conotoxin n=1 Tax=Conus spurius TaxID=192919 RepID=D0V1Y2_CONSP|nr:I-superfamily Sr11.10 conotoxin precursor [Conus spurius]